jgi:hydroxymethylbilane synthase
MMQSAGVTLLLVCCCVVSTYALTGTNGMNRNVIRLGTRGSPLALVQANTVKQMLESKFPALTVQIKEIMTKGDSILNQALSEIGGKGLFVKELDTALLNDEVDICVHSMKDVPTVLHEGTVLPCTLPREVTNDVFISEKYKSLKELPDFAVIGSASLRRKSQLLKMNPTWKVVNFRGNVQSRLRKLRNGDVDGTLLALAGLKRLNMYDLIEKSEIVPFQQVLPAIAQGAIGIQCRDCDHDIVEMLKVFDDLETSGAIHSERCFLAALDGNCRTPMGAQVRFLHNESVTGTSSRISFTGLVAKPDGSDLVKIAIEMPFESEISDSTRDQFLHEAGDVGTKIGRLVRSKLIGKKKYELYKESFGTGE